MSGTMPEMKRFYIDQKENWGVKKSSVTSSLTFSVNPYFIITMTIGQLL